MTIHKLVRLTRESAAEFVRVASHCDFDIDIANVDVTSYTVDAKSMLGVMGLNFRRPMLVSYSGYNRDLEEFLSDNAAVA